jgi:hypothetical protein
MPFYDLHFVTRLDCFFVSHFLRTQDHPHPDGPNKKSCTFIFFQTLPAISKDIEFQ